MKKFDITGMSCAACVSRVEKAVSSLEGVSACSVNLLTNSMTVDGNIADVKIIDAVKKAGYGATPSNQKNKQNKEEIDDSKEKRVLLRLLALMN